MQLRSEYEWKFWKWYLATYLNAELGSITFGQLKTWSTYRDFQNKPDVEKCAIFNEFLEYHRIFAILKPEIEKGEVRFDYKVAVARPVEGQLQFKEIARHGYFNSSVQAQLHAFDQVQDLIPELAY